MSQPGVIGVGRFKVELAVANYEDVAKACLRADLRGALAAVAKAGGESARFRTIQV